MSMLRTLFNVAEFIVIIDKTLVCYLYQHWRLTKVTFLLSNSAREILSSSATSELEVYRRVWAIFLQMLGNYLHISYRFFKWHFSPPVEKANRGIRPGLPVTVNWSKKAITQTASKNFSLIYNYPLPFVSGSVVQNSKEVFFQETFSEEQFLQKNKIPPRLSLCALKEMSGKKCSMSLKKAMCHPGYDFPFQNKPKRS